MRIRHLPTLLLALFALPLLPACNHSRGPAAGRGAGAGLPASLTLVQAAPQAAVRCGGSGLRVVHGLDYDHDGRLGPFERLGEEVLCIPPGDAPDLRGAAAVSRAEPRRHWPGGG